MRIVAAILAAVLALAGCIGDTGGTVSSTPTPGEASSPAAEPVLVEIAIRQGRIDPQGERVQVKVGQDVTLRVTSDAAEEIHVHSDPERTYKVEPGGVLQETFSIDRPGQVAIEAHEFGVTIVQLVVRP
jgi:hypothetical protein